MFVAFLALYCVLMLICLGVTCAGVWTSFSKAGRPGWACIVPIYGAIVWLDIAGKPWWWLFILVAPTLFILLGFVLGFALGSFLIILLFYVVGAIGVLALSFIVCIPFARNYGQGIGFAIGLLLLPPVFYPLLGFGDAEYLRA